MCIRDRIALERGDLPAARGQLGGEEAVGGADIEGPAAPAGAETREDERVARVRIVLETVRRAAHAYMVSRSGPIRVESAPARLQEQVQAVGGKRPRCLLYTSPS